MPKKKIITYVTVLIAVLATGWFLFFHGNKIDIEKQEEGRIGIAGMNFPESALSGVKCEKAKTRPLAVMLSGDKEARPLSGISEADMVFEMPVTDNGVTRMMAVFQCNWPKEIGSVRSSRLDFIPLAQGLNAIYAHWGGEREALKQLDDHVIDNINALKYDGTTFYRKNQIKPPHNGFTSSELIKKAIKDLGYSLNKAVVAYPHQKAKSLGAVEPPAIYQSDSDFEVSWSYNSKNNSYLRSHRGQAEIDKNSGKQVEAKNVVLLKTTWSPINKDYIRVVTVGSGEINAYQNGQKIDGSWEKKSSKDKLYFYDSQHKEIKFNPGLVWVEIVTE